MKKAAACLLLVLVVSSLVIAMAPNVKSQQVENVKVLTYSRYVDMLGNLIIVGEVQNIGNSVVSSVYVAGRITGSEGSQSQSDNRVWGTYLLPQQKAPFYLQFSRQDATGMTWYALEITNVELIAYRAPTTTQYQYQNVTVTEHHSSTSAAGEYWVNGELRNTGSQTAGNVTVVATFYNSEGTPIAVGYTNPIATIQADATKTFKVGAFDLNQTGVPSDKKISSYSLLVQVESPMQKGQVPVATPNPTGQSSQSDPTSSTNTGNNLTLDATTIGMIAAVIVVVVVVLLLLTRRKPKNAVSTKPAEKSGRMQNKKRKR